MAKGNDSGFSDLAIKIERFFSLVNIVKNIIANLRFFNTKFNILT